MECCTAHERQVSNFDDDNNLKTLIRKKIWVFSWPQHDKRQLMVGPIKSGGKTDLLFGTQERPFPHGLRFENYITDIHKSLVSAKEYR
ncbi:unnamed protein product, partial [Trichogramma brassicae]